MKTPAFYIKSLIAGDTALQLLAEALFGFVYSAESPLRVEGRPGRPPQSGRAAAAVILPVRSGNARRIPLQVGLPVSPLGMHATQAIS